MNIIKYIELCTQECLLRAKIRPVSKKVNLASYKYNLGRYLYIFLIKKCSL